MCMSQSVCVCVFKCFVLDACLLLSCMYAYILNYFFGNSADIGKSCTNCFLFCSSCRKFKTGIFRHFKFLFFYFSRIGSQWMVAASFSLTVCWPSNTCVCYQISPAFKKNFALLLRKRSMKHPFERVPTPYQVYSWLSPQPDHPVDYIRAEDGQCWLWVGWGAFRDCLLAESVSPAVTFWNSANARRLLKHHSYMS